MLYPMLYSKFMIAGLLFVVIGFGICVRNYRKGTGDRRVLKLAPWFLMAMAVISLTVSFIAYQKMADYDLVKATVKQVSHQCDKKSDTCTYTVTTDKGRFDITSPESRPLKVVKGDKVAYMDNHKGDIYYKGVSK